MDRKGKEELLEAQPDAYSSPKLSPDGTQLALTVGSGENADIWIWDLVRKTPSRLTFEKGEDSRPAWSPDGKRIAFFSNRGNEPGVYWKAADGTGPVEKLVTASGLNISDLCWSSDGKALVLEEGADTGGDITMVSAEGNHERKPLLREEYTEANPQVSPDGRWLAYLSTESNASQGEIYVRPFPDVDSGKWQVSTGGGQEPRWSRDSRELFYRSGDDGAVMAVAVETEPAFRRGIPKELFRGDYYRQRGHNWDISHDGKRFLMIKPPQAATSEASPDAQPQKFNIVLNWFEELKRLAPVK